MKKFFIFLCIFFSSYGCDYNSIEKSKVFGGDKFSSDKWKESSPAERSSMIHSFLISNDITKMNANELYTLLGESTAYYEYDEFPAYSLLLEEAVYIVAFPINRKTGTIRKVIFEPPLK